MAEPQAPAEDRKRKEGSITSSFPTTTSAFTAVRRIAAAHTPQHGEPPATRRSCSTTGTHHSTGRRQPPLRLPHRQHAQIEA
jgi:hypothetical protein